jgi:hypothetical protein
MKLKSLIYIICTAEKSVKEMFSYQKIETILSVNKINKTLFSINYDKLEKVVPRKDIIKLQELENDYARLTNVFSEHQELKLKIDFFKNDFEREVLSIIN